MNKRDALRILEIVPFQTILILTFFVNANNKI